MYHRINLVGRVATRPSMGHTFNDTLRTEFRVSVSGQTPEERQMVNILAWCDLAELALELRPDDLIFVTGEVEEPLVQFDRHNNAYAVTTVTAHVIEQLTREASAPELAPQASDRHLPPTYPRNRHLPLLKPVVSKDAVPSHHNANHMRTWNNF